MTDQTLFGKPLCDLTKQRHDGADASKNADAFAARLPATIDCALLDDLSDLEKEILVQIANTAVYGRKYAARNDFVVGDFSTEDDAAAYLEQAFSNQERGLVRIFYDAFREYDSNAITGLRVKGAPPAVISLEELENNTGCKTHYEYFYQTAKAHLDFFLAHGKLSIHSLNQEDSDPDVSQDTLLLLWQFYVQIDSQYFITPNIPLLTPYFAMMARTMKLRVTGEFENKELKELGKIESGENGELLCTEKYQRIGGGNAYVLDVLSVFEKNGVSLQGELATLREELLSGLENDLLDVTTRAIVRGSVDRAGYVQDAGYILRHLQTHNTKRFQKWVRNLRSDDEFKDAFEKINEEYVEQHELLGYVKALLEGET